MKGLNKITRIHKGESKADNDSWEYYHVTLCSWQRSADAWTNNGCLIALYHSQLTCFAPSFINLLVKFSPWHFVSIEFLTPYSAFACFTWCFVPREDTRVTLLHISPDTDRGPSHHRIWIRNQDLNDIETFPHKVVTEEHVWNIYLHQHQGDAELGRAGWVAIYISYYSFNWENYLLLW